MGEWNVAAFVDAHSLEVTGRSRDHHGVVSTVAISPDGKSLVSGGWDKTLVLHGSPKPQIEKFGWALRRARFSHDGRWLVVAAWTPQNALGDHQSDPSAVVYEVLWDTGASVVK